MDKFFLRCAFAIAAVMLAARPAAAWTCDEFATLAVKASTEIRGKGGCGFDLTNSFWSTNKGTQYRWCQALANSNPDAVETRLKDLTAQAAKCDYCKIYARLMNDAARDNISYGCGFKTNDGRWTPDYNYHFDGCMAHSNYKGCGFGFVCYVTPSTLGEDAETAKEDLDPNIGDVTQQIAECKLRHPVPKGCMSGCHGNSPSALLPAALRPLSKRGNSTGDNAITRQPPSFKPEGTSSGDNDLAKPGERRRNPRSNRGTSSGDSDQAKRGAQAPCGTRRNPCKPASGGNSNSAIDRLSGGGMQVTPSAGSQGGGGSPSSPSAGGGASSAPAGSGSPTLDPRGITRTGPMFNPSPGLR